MNAWILLPMVICIFAAEISSDIIISATFWRAMWQNFIILPILSLIGKRWNREIFWTWNCAKTVRWPIPLPLGRFSNQTSLPPCLNGMVFLFFQILKKIYFLCKLRKSGFCLFG